MHKLIFGFVMTAAIAGAGMRKDIEFAKAGDVSLKLDAFVPEGKGPFPTVVLVHGGGWTGGDRWNPFKRIYDPLSQAGFVWFTVDYRLAPKYRYPAAIDDVVAAIKYVEAHAGEYKVDPKRLAISGESAGGHIVAYIGARYGAQLHIAAVVPFYPAIDLDALVEGGDNLNGRARPALGAFLGFTEVNDEARQRMRDASPATYVHPGMPPYLFVHGTKDETVNIHQSQLMCTKMKEAGNTCEVYPVEGAPHWVEHWEGHPEWMGYKQKVPEWLKQTMR